MNPISDNAPFPFMYVTFIQKGTVKLDSHETNFCVKKIRNENENKKLFILTLVQIKDLNLKKDI